MPENTPSSQVADFIRNSRNEQPVAAEMAAPSSETPGQDPPVSAAPLLTSAAAPVVSEPVQASPSASAAAASSERRDLAYFTTPAKQVTKKQSVYLPVELHRALATVVNLPGVDVSLSDLLANIVQAWRDEHRAEVRKRYREGEKGI